MSVLFSGKVNVYVVDSNGPDYIYSVDKESILNAYPDELIK